MIKTKTLIKRKSKGRASGTGLAALTDRLGCFHADNTVRS